MGRHGVRKTEECAHEDIVTLSHVSISKYILDNNGGLLFGLQGTWSLIGSLFRWLPVMRKEEK